MSRVLPLGSAGRRLRANKAKMGIKSSKLSTLLRNKMELKKFKLEKLHPDKILKKWRKYWHRKIAKKLKIDLKFRRPVGLVSPYQSLNTLNYNLRLWLIGRENLRTALRGNKRRKCAHTLCPSVHSNCELTTQFKNSKCLSYSHSRSSSHASL